MATVDLATPLLGDFSTQLDVAFGSTLGWIFGHLIILGMAGILIQSMRKTSLLSKNFDISSAKITNFIGYSIAFIIQYQIFITFSIKPKDSEKIAAFDLYPLQITLEFDNFFSSFLASSLLE